MGRVRGGCVAQCTNQKAAGSTLDWTDHTPEHVVAPHVCSCQTTMFPNGSIKWF